MGTSEFAGRLQRARLSQGMTVRGLARRTGYSPAQISKVENGKARASAAFARLCDAALGMDGELLKAVAREEGNAGEPVPSERYQGWHLSLTLGGNSELHPLGDRQGPPLMRFAPPAVEQQVEKHSLDAMRTLHETTRALGRTTSPGVVLPLAVTQAHMLRTLTREARGEDRRRLLALGVRVFEHAGWMAQEAGDDSAALWWTDDAVRIASELGDLDMPRYALIRRALVMYYQRRPTRTAELAGRVADDRSASPALRWMAGQRVAQGFALAGDYAASMRALERAERWQASADFVAPGAGGPGPGTTHLCPPGAVALGPAFAPGSTTLITGWCLYDAGLPARAVEELRGGLARIPDDGHRARARFTARLALALAANRELEEAAVHLDAVLGHVRRVESATIRADLIDLNRTLGRWPRDKAARELRLRLAEVIQD